MRILITGAQGTLGRILTNELAGRGHEVFGCDLSHSEGPQQIRADIRDARQLERAFTRFGKIDLVYNLAAEFGRHNGQEYYEQLWSTNLIGNRNVIEACLKHGVRMVLASSSEAYGDEYDFGSLKRIDTRSLKETDLDFAAPFHHNEYAMSKWAQERQVFIAAQNDGLSAVVLRFFNAYGPGEYYTPYRSVVCLFCYRLLFGLPITLYKDYHRVFMWVGDWAVTAANAAERFDELPRAKGMSGSRPGSVPVYNIGGTEYRSVESMAEVILKNLPKARTPQLNFVEKETANVTNKLPDVTLAKRDLGHDPQVTLEQGIPETLDWMRSVYSFDGKLLQHVCAVDAVALS